MSGEIKPIKEKTRKVKNHIIDQYLRLADRVDEKGVGDLTENESNKYWELTTIFAKSVLPRTQEVTGEDGGALEVNLINYANKDVISTPQTNQETPKE